MGFFWGQVGELRMGAGWREKDGASRVEKMVNDILKREARNRGNETNIGVWFCPRGHHPRSWKVKAET